MLTHFNKKSIGATMVAFLLVFLVGCSSFSASQIQNSTNTKVEDDISPSPTKNNNDSNSTLNSPTETNTAEGTKNSVGTAVAQPNAAQKETLANIKKLALQGKIINSEFPVKNTVIDDVEKKLGKADKTDWVPAAKGNYSTFSKYNVVFGYNKGMQIFEARSFDSRLKKITLSMVKSFYGTPAYDVKYNGEEILGYTSSKEFKILFVFSKVTKAGSEGTLDHYSVLYPRGTVNSMADYPGREW